MIEELMWGRPQSGYILSRITANHDGAVSCPGAPRKDKRENQCL